MKYETDRTEDHQTFTTRLGRIVLDVPVPDRQRVSLPNAGIVEHIVENHGQPILDDGYANYGVREWDTLAIRCGCVQYDSPEAGCAGLMSALSFL